jgi:hypothetical protein
MDAITVNEFGTMEPKSCANPTETEAASTAQLKPGTTSYIATQF